MDPQGPHQPLDPILDPSAYDFDLPESSIAKEPPGIRGMSRLLHIPREARGAGTFKDHHFTDLPELLPPGAALVINNTRVLPARLLGKRPGGGKVELLLADPLPGPTFSRWRTFTRPAARVREGMILTFEGGLEAKALRRWDRGWEVELTGPAPLEALLDKVGHMPLPPYINRPDTDSDKERYQTVFAQERGAVAAPTAGLHFTQPLLDSLAAAGHPIVHITLHVGLGTFAPLREEQLHSRQLHGERYRVEAPAWEALRGFKREGRPIIACGTTSVRTLETLALKGGGEGSLPDAALSGISTLFIYPGFDFKMVDGLITNFHLPRSSLLMLVAAFAGRQRILDAYAHGVEAGYSFYSYGDANFIF